jgi:Hypothetical glycosyl hydrolase 6
VNSISCFARCHHGWLYFDSKAFPERKHPHLQKELPPQQIEACHRRGIRVPIYITVQWDHYTATRQLDTIALRISRDRSTPNLEQKLVSMPQSATTM